jgi:hypothetical protein
LPNCLDVSATAACDITAKKGATVNVTAIASGGTITL